MGEGVRKYQMELSFVPDGFISVLLFRLFELGPKSKFTRDKWVMVPKEKVLDGAGKKKDQDVVQ
jgi:hypothetical protein